MSDDVEITEEESHASEAVARLKKELARCKKERKEYLDGWKRAKADALNEKRRQIGALDSERDSATAKAVTLLLPILDSIRLATAQQSGEASKSGMDQVHAQCLRSFNDLGVTIVDPLGEPFDPHRHQSLGSKPVSSEKEEDTVVEVAQVGAVAGDRVIRAAMVYVGAKKEADGKE